MLCNTSVMQEPSLRVGCGIVLVLPVWPSSSDILHLARCLFLFALRAVIQVIICFYLYLYYSLPVLLLLLIDWFIHSFIHLFIDRNADISGRDLYRSADEEVALSFRGLWKSSWSFDRRDCTWWEGNLFQLLWAIISNPQLIALFVLSFLFLFSLHQTSDYGFLLSIEAPMIDDPTVPGVNYGLAVLR